MRIGIFGGTFDPPHLGHLIAAQEVHFQLGLDRLILIPAAFPPHKRGRQVTPASIRLEMLRAAVGDDARFEVSDIEVRRNGPSYTVDTLRQLRSAWPCVEFFLAIGADQVAELSTWKAPAEIPTLAVLAGFRREGQALPKGWPGKVVTVPMLAISSTDIRRRAGAGEPFSYLVPEAVEAVIRREGLYGL